MPGGPKESPILKIKMKKNKKSIDINRGQIFSEGSIGIYIGSIDIERGE